ncbi:MAG: peptidase M1 [Flavobacteriaceae bacterium]|nr:peptidase M1 [Flavobacteriaceae bacterium]OUX40503.1 MAG: peptidase M1 [Flavobacteriaceae bacterium TMED265]
MQKTIVLIALCLSLHLNAQEFTRQDSLRGSITKERMWWDVLRYDLDIEVDIDNKYIQGKNIMTYKVLDDSIRRMQIDLQTPMQIDSVLQNRTKLNISREDNVYWIDFSNIPVPNTENSIEIYFQGHPKEAVRAPWDGGFSWKKDDLNLPFVATSCQGLGASVWWPNKDHMYDEAESLSISVTVPEGLVNVSNGRLKNVEYSDGKAKYVYEVKNPINNYGVNINIGNYTSYQEVYQGENGPLDISYHVLKQDLEKAKQQFKQVPMMLEAFEYWFGPYPFYEDSFKLVQVPYLGMEHQSSVTYGNQFQNGYLGRDLSGTGWGLEFDFIIVHEAGHEWFANNITYKDAADMWLHESFTAYSESLYLDYHFGKKAAQEYVRGTRRYIENKGPIIGWYGVNQPSKGNDKYYKGSNVIHTLRQWIDDDKKFRMLLRGLNTEFYHSTVTTSEIEDYITEFTELPLKVFFNQYLRQTNIPTLEYKIENNELHFRYADDCLDGFEMPLKINVAEQTQWIFPEKSWKSVTLTHTNDLVFDPNFYINTVQLK